MPRGIRWFCGTRGAKSPHANNRWQLDLNRPRALTIASGGPAAEEFEEFENPRIVRESLFERVDVF